MNKIIKENPTFVLMLGMCPALAVTTKLESAYLMGICVMIILIFSNTVISIIRKLIPDNVRIPCYILIIGTFVTIMEVLLKKYVNNLYEVLGIYLPLIVVNCIVLGRALSVASKENVKNSIIDAIAIGIGFTLSLSLIGLIRELLGTGSITLMDSTSSLTNVHLVLNVFKDGTLLPMNFLIKPAGSFLVMGLLMALFNKIRGVNNESN